jgi:hypothetical protein
MKNAILYLTLALFISSCNAQGTALPLSNETTPSASSTVVAQPSKAVVTQPTATSTNEVNPAIKLDTLIPDESIFRGILTLKEDMVTTNEYIIKESTQPELKEREIEELGRVLGYYRTFENKAFERSCYAAKPTVRATVNVILYKSVAHARTAMNKYLVEDNFGVWYDNEIDSIGDELLVRRFDPFTSKCGEGAHNQDIEMLSAKTYYRKDNAVVMVYIEALTQRMPITILGNNTVALTEMIDKNIQDNTEMIALARVDESPNTLQSAPQAFTAKIQVSDKASFLSAVRPTGSTSIVKVDDGIYKFVGEKGRKLELQVEHMGGLILIEVFDPQGKKFYSAQGSTYLEDMTLTLDGVYEVRLQFSETVEKIVPLKCQTTLLCEKDYRNTYEQNSPASAIFTINMR